jgi:hypothetical protein
MMPPALTLLRGDARALPLSDNSVGPTPAEFLDALIECTPTIPGQIDLFGGAM